MGLAKIAGKKLAEKAAEGALESVAKQAKALPRMSETLNPHVGKRLFLTQADRMAIDPDKNYLGGTGFLDLAELKPKKYNKVAWAVEKPQTATTMVRAMGKHEEEPIWTTFVGSPTQHKSNRVVFNMLMDEFEKAIAQDKLTPELKQKINAKLSSLRDDKTGKAFFPEDVDITHPDFKEQSDAFHLRSMIADILSGKDVGGQKGKIIPFEKVMHETSDPMLENAPTFGVGNRLFRLSGNILENRPDLHPAYPTILEGEKLSDPFEIAPIQIGAKPWAQKYEGRPKPIGSFDLTRGYNPSFKITDEYLQGLFDAGYAGGGLAKKIAKKLAQGATESSKAFQKINFGDVVSGNKVRNEIPNRSSIGASLYDYKIDGIQEVPMSAFEVQGKPKYRSVEEENYTKNLANQIKENQELNPLIVVKDKDGYYVLEGAHRFDALRELDTPSFPALVVHDMESLGEQSYGFGGITKKIAKKAVKELPEAIASGKTPIATTVGTYRKASPMLLEDIKDVNAPVLDYGAGMGLGAEELRKTFPNVKTLEPFYKGNFDFTDPFKVPSGEFKGLTNFSVLNAVTPEVRDSIVENIGRVMDRGGVGLITARSPSAVMSTKGMLADEPNAMITQKGTYQKGFDTNELREYIKYILGSDFEYEPLKGLSGTSIKVKKKADGGTITAPEIEVKPEYETLKEIPRGKISGKIADVLKPASEFLEQYEVLPQVPLLGGTDLAELTGVKGVQTLADDISRGYRPIRNLERGKLQTSFFDPRLVDVADLATTAAGGVGLAKNLGKAAIKEAGRQIETGTGLLGRNVINPRMNIIKDPGGMVVGGEKALDDGLISIKRNERPNAPRLTPNLPFGEMVNEINQIPKDPNAVALNAWIDTKVKKYIRNQAGSKDDPILKAIESGVEHNFNPPQSGDTKYTIAMKRKFAGKDPQGIATTERGKDWEYTVDSIFNPVKSSEIKDILQRNKDLPPSEASDKFLTSVLRTEHDLPVYTKKDLDALQLINQIPDETVYGLNPVFTNKLGLDHMTDVLMEDLNAGRLRPEQLNQMSMEKAIRRVAEYDAEKAKIASKAEADRIKDLPIPITYNKDYKWLELKHPTDAKITKEALESEGNQMGHCVGTHCDYYNGVMNGSKQIFSLRDANNVPHVTIETNIKRNLDRWLNANKETIANDPKLSKMLFTDDFDSKYPRSVRDDEDLANDYIGDITKIMKEKGLPINEDPGAYVNIKQVKGNKNSRPKDPYQNYVTDFIQKNPTGHEIVDIHELENTNLMSVNDVARSGIVPKEIHFHPDVEKAMSSFYPAFKNLMAADKDELTYRLFKTAAKDLSRKNKPYFTGEDLLENIRNKYLPKPRASGGPIDLETEYKLKNMRRRYG